MSAIWNREVFTSQWFKMSMGKSIGGMSFVHSIVVRFSEGPLLEVLLYIPILYTCVWYCAKCAFSVIFVLPL